MKKLAIIFAAAFAANAFAGSLSADYAISFSKNVQFHTTFGGYHDQTTVQWNATKTGGTTTLVNGSYNAYCVELGEFITPGTNATHTNVTNLGGSQTDAGGTSGVVSFNPTRTDYLERLWGTYYGSVVDSKTSAAFQLATWELAFDTDASLLDDTKRMWGYDTDSGTAGIQLGNTAALAQSWLTAVKNGSANKKQSLVLLSGRGVQDLITVVPEPSTYVALGLGAAFLLRRRKK